jgi:hypothetical protein
MPAINVARTDTFEIQRQKINQIGNQIFNISQGGSDLATGNLKLGDGTKDSPSLSFISDTKLGLYKSDLNTLGFVSDGKKITEVKDDSFLSFVDLTVRKKTLKTSGITITDFGSGYEAGIYNNINLLGGSGNGATGNFVVTKFTGTLTDSGAGYIPGNYGSVLITGGSGTGAIATISVDGVSGNITNPGSGYLPDESYVGVPLIGGTGNGAECAVVTDQNGEISFVTLTTQGVGYSNGDVLTVNNSDVGGQGSGFEYTITSNPGQVTSILFSDKGTGYQVNDVLQPYGVITNISTTVDDQFLEMVVPSVEGIQLGSTVTKISGTGELDTNTIVVQIDSATNTVYLSTLPLVSGSIVVSFTPEFGVPTRSLSFTVDTIGPVETFNLVDVGVGYDISDTIGVSPFTLISPITYNVSVSDPGSGDRFFIDTGSGPVETPNITLYTGNTYIFDYSDGSNAGHVFSLSEFPDGIWSPSLIENVSTTLDTGSTQITVATTQNILPGMEVFAQSGSIGNLAQNTKVLSVDSSTTITLSIAPISDGSADLTFSGYEYLDGVVRDSQNLTLTIKVTEQTPNLYFYCLMHEDMGGSNGSEALLTIDLNNPRTFGSGFQISVFDIDSVDVVSGNVNTGLLKSNSIESSSGNISNIASQTISTSTLVAQSSVTTASVLSNSSLLINAQTLDIDADVEIGNSFEILEASGNLTTSGILKTFGSLNINDRLNLQDEEISSSSGYDILLQPASGRVIKSVSTTALIIPSGSTAQRPTGVVIQDGAIRFNTTTNQYEGYSSSASSWSSLGGVRDIDGNTYILAELTPASNDNTLWFYNDNVNTLKLTTQFLDFRNVKKISSGRLGLPAFTLWSANTPVTTGQYLKYRNNLYEVTSDGVTAGTGNEPTHTSGVSNNGTAQLTWYSSAVSPLEFTEIEELRVGPNKDCPLVVSSELKLFNNVVSTIVEDLVLRPNSGKKVTIDAPTSFVIPVGNTNQRGSASQGSIRYNTTISQFEGYSGVNWSSLGGVRDVDGNTYIIPETAPAANENILFFYNNNVNTIQLTETELDFTNIDTITTSGGNSLAINTDIVTLSNQDTTIDNSSITSSFISTTKQYLDLGVASGVTVDPILRLDDTGDVYLNTGFGTGTFSGVKIFDSDLKDFELADYLIKSSTFDLVKGTSETSAVNLYNTATAKGCKVTVICKSSSGKKSMAEYSVIDNGVDIFYSEIGSLNTSADGFSASFDFTAGNETRVTLTLSDDHTAGDTVSFTVLTQTIK